MTTPNEIPWIEHHGGECPVPGETVVEIEFRGMAGTVIGPASKIRRWEHNDPPDEYDIVRYRISAQPVAQESDEKQDEHGNPIACMYRIKFPDPNTESYFYTERSYRILESRLRAQSAELELSKADAKAARAGCCTVCWTNSFEPCEESDQGAVAYKDGAGFVRCQHCYMIEGFRKCKAELEQVKADLEYHKKLCVPKTLDELEAVNLRSLVQDLSSDADRADMSHDEFSRVEALVQNDGGITRETRDEILHLCKRAKSDIKQRVPVIEQRDKAQSDLATATAQLAERDAQVAELVRALIAARQALFQDKEKWPNTIAQIDAATSEPQP